jgi:hypothetical protein
MKAEEFIAKQEKKHGNFGIFYPPSTAEEALSALSDHFLGEEWYTANPTSQEQIHTEIVALILEKNPQSKTFCQTVNRETLIGTARNNFQANGIFQAVVYFLAGVGVTGILMSLLNL